MTSEQKEFVINLLRRHSYTWYAFSIAKVRARVARGQYLCAECDEVFGPKLIELDHIDPVVPVMGWDNLEAYVGRHLVRPEQLQVLCKPCHHAKSALEGVQRRAFREAKKKAG